MTSAMNAQVYSTTDALLLIFRPGDHRVDLFREAVGCIIEAKPWPVPRPPSLPK